MFLFLTRPLRIQTVFRLALIQRKQRLCQFLCLFQTWDASEGDPAIAAVPCNQCYNKFNFLSFHIFVSPSFIESFGASLSWPLRCVSSCCMCLAAKSGFPLQAGNHVVPTTAGSVLCSRHPSLFIPLAVTQLPFDPCISVPCRLSLGAQLLPFRSLTEVLLLQWGGGSNLVHAHTSHSICDSLAITDLRLPPSSRTSEQTRGALLVYISTVMTCCRGRKSPPSRHLRQRCAYLYVQDDPKETSWGALL